MRTNTKRSMVGLVTALVVGGLGVSCGGGQKDAVTSGTTTTTTTTTSTSSVGPEDDETSPSTKAAVAAATDSPPVTAADGSIVLENLLKKGDGGYPKATAQDADCMKGLALGGNHDEDYEALVERCGAATGLKEYAKKVTGSFDDKQHRRVYTFNMQGGFCYRFFVVADDTISNVDVRVQRPDGALVSIDQSKSSVAIMDPDRVWCKTHDREFRLVVETSAGTGKFVMGVWARPK